MYFGGRIRRQQIPPKRLQHLLQNYEVPWPKQPQTKFSAQWKPQISVDNIDSCKFICWLRCGGHSFDGFREMRLHSTRMEQLLQQMGKTRAEGKLTAAISGRKRVKVLLGKSPRPRLSEYIQSTSMRFRQWEAVKITAVVFGLMAPSTPWVVTNVSEPVVCSFEIKGALKKGVASPQKTL